MIPGTLVLLGSPLLAPGSWSPLPGALQSAGLDVLDAYRADDDVPPFGQRYLTGVVLAVRASACAGPLVLIGHSGAGPLLPAVGRALRDAGCRVGGYVFLDATLPGFGLVSRLDLLRLENPEISVALQAVLDDGGTFPDWTLPGVTTRPRGLAFFTEALPTSDDWPDAPCGYIRTSTAYLGAARQARARGWPVVGLSGTLCKWRGLRSRLGGRDGTGSCS